MAAGRRVSCTCLTLSMLVASHQVPPRVFDNVDREADLITDHTSESPDTLSESGLRKQAREADLIVDHTWEVPDVDVSHFHQVAQIGGLSDVEADRLIDAIRKAAAEMGTFIVTVTDGGMLGMALNMIHSLDTAPCHAPRLVIGLGANLCPTFEGLPITTCVEVFQEEAGSEDEVAWGSHEYWQVVFRKHVVLTLVGMSQMARHVIYADPDIVFLGSPVTYFDTEKSYDIIFSPNNMLDPNATRVDDVADTYETRGMENILIGPHNRRADINTGLFQMKSNQNVADLMLKTMEIFRDQEFVHGHYQQYSLVKALDELPYVKIGVAGGDKLVNGNVFWGHRELLPEDGVISIHANWMPCQLKIPCLKEANLWVDPNNPQRLTFTPKRMVARMDYRYATVEECGEKAALEPSAIPETAKPTTQAPARPTEPGCYLWLPKGCPQHNFHAQDDWRKTEATRDRPQCTNEVKDLFKTWCGTNQVETLYIAPPPANGPPEPSAPGCYVWMPGGCEKQRFHAQSAWRQTTSYTDQDSCTNKAPEKYNRWCDARDAFAVWVAAAPEPPQEPGCFAWFPTGCKLNPISGNLSTRWIRDGWGEKHAGASVDKVACTETRKAAIDEWCGIANAQMVFVEDG